MGAKDKEIVTFNIYLLKILHKNLLQHCFHAFAKANLDVDDISGILPKTFV